VSSLAVLANGRRVLSCSDDRSLRLWDLESGAELARFMGDNSMRVVGVRQPQTGQYSVTYAAGC